ncbi:XapX domain-containing protein [Bradyrhizobium sp. USDA 4501]
MKVYFMSLGAVLLVELTYSSLNVRSPAPSLVALVGLFGIHVCGQRRPVSKELHVGSSIVAA